MGDERAIGFDAVFHWAAIASDDKGATLKELSREGFEGTSLSGEELDPLEMDITAVAGKGRLLSIAERAQAVNSSCLDRRRSSPLS